MAAAFNPPSEWCDRRCERCPLAEGCAVFIRDRGRRWAHEMRGVDPDDSDVLFDDMMSDLASTQAMLEDYAEEEGIDLDAPLPETPVVLEAVRLNAAAKTLAMVIGPAQGDPLSGLVLLLVGKVARIASFLEQRALVPEDEGPSIWDLDAAPNLFLLEHLRRELAGLLGMRGRMDALAALAQLDQLLDPLTADVEQHRPAFEALVREGAAPSPFVVVEHAQAEDAES